MPFYILNDHKYNIPDSLLRNTVYHRLPYKKIYRRQLNHLRHFLAFQSDGWVNELADTKVVSSMLTRMIQTRVRLIMPLIRICVTYIICLHTPVS